MSDLFTPRTAVVTIYQGDYLDRITHLEKKAEALEAAQTGLPLTNGESPEYLAVAAEHDALVAEAEETAVRIRLKNLPRQEWTAMIAKHPPRTAEKDGVSKQEEARDAMVGVNEATFMEELVPASIVEPEVSAEDLAALSFGYFNNLYLTAFALNRTVGADPKADLVSRMTKANDETSS